MELCVHFETGCIFLGELRLRCEFLGRWGTVVIEEIGGLIHEMRAWWWKLKYDEGGSRGMGSSLGDFEKGEIDYITPTLSP